MNLLHCKYKETLVYDKYHWNTAMNIHEPLRNTEIITCNMSHIFVSNFMRKPGDDKPQSSVCHQNFNMDNIFWSFD